MNDRTFCVDEVKGMEMLIVDELGTVNIVRFVWAYHSVVLDRTVLGIEVCEIAAALLFEETGDFEAFGTGCEG